MLAMTHVLAVLSHHFPKTGGPHAYVYEAFGPRASFYVAWTYWIVSWLSSMPLLLTASDAVNTLVGPFSTRQLAIIETFIIALVLGVNLMSLRATRLCEQLLSFLKLAPLVVIPLVGIWNWDVTQLAIPQGVPPLKALGEGCLLTVFAFIGFEAGTTPAGEVLNARRTLGRGLFLGTLIVVSVYILNTLVILGATPLQTLQHSPNAFTAFLGTLGSKNWSMPMAAFTLFAMIGTLNSWMLITAHVSLGAAEEGLFPSIFLRRNHQHSPVIGVLTTAGLLFTGAWLLHSQTISEKLTMLIDFSSTAYLLVCLACLGSAQWLMITGRIPWRWAVWGTSIIGEVFCIWCFQRLAFAHYGHLIAALAFPASGILMMILGWNKQKAFTPAGPSATPEAPHTPSKDQS